MFPSRTTTSRSASWMTSAAGSRPDAEKAAGPVTALRSPWAVAGLGALLALALLLPGLGEAPFDDPGEGQHAEIAREAWASGKLLDLRLNGVRYFDKLPLLYWLIALDFRAWGPSEWAARLPSVAGAAGGGAAPAASGW